MGRYKDCITLISAPLKKSKSLGITAYGKLIYIMVHIKLRSAVVDTKNMQRLSRSRYPKDTVSMNYFSHALVIINKNMQYTLWRNQQNHYQLDNCMVYHCYHFLKLQIFNLYLGIMCNICHINIIKPGECLPINLFLLKNYGLI